ncbi:MAG: hypothetical protein J0M12_07445 [Deltaproteobacteria bacterium]|nr:hypothetical protein [Deltaproteobacteria bacterium]
MSGPSEQSTSIIQCPQCQTKFAVDGSVLAEVASPRFHCSRCDFVFGLELKAQPTPAPRPSYPAFSINEPRASTAAEENTARAVGNAPAWSMATPSIDRSTTPRGLEIPKMSTGNAAPKAPHESHNDNFDFTQMDLDFKKREPLSDPFSISSFDTASAAAIPSPKIETPAAPREALPSFEYQRPATRWTGLAYTAAPLVFFLSILMGASFYLRQHHEQAEKLFSSLSKHTAQVAPAELSIVNPKFKRVALDSGESAYLVSGSIKNASQETFRDLKLEAVGFDEGGELVARTQVDAGATLTKTRVRSLTSEMIKNLQSGQLKNKVELKPGESEDFTIALLDGDPSKARFFATRIYSVTY